MAIMPLSIIPGFMPALQVAVEKYVPQANRESSCPPLPQNASASMKQINGLQNIRSERVVFLASHALGMSVQVTIAVAYASMKLLSHIFWAGAILSSISFAVNIYLILSANNEIARLQAIEKEALAPPEAKVS